MTAYPVWQSKLAEMGYPSKASFEADLARVFANALAYYLPGTRAHDDVLHVQVPNLLTCGCHETSSRMPAMSELTV